MVKKLLLLSIISIILIGCDDAERKSAKIIDSTVEGLEYQCAGSVHYTNKDGIATCKHMPMGFKVGEIFIGMINNIPKDGIIVPQDMVGVNRSNINNENVKKVTIILQTLDADHNPSNGITISKDTREKLKIFVDMQHTSLNDIKDIIDAQLGDQNYTTAQNAIKHLRRSMKLFNVK